MTIENNVMTAKSALESLIAEVQASLDVAGIIPQRRTYLEGGLYYLQQLRDLTGGSVGSGKDSKSRKARPGSIGTQNRGKDEAAGHSLQPLATKTTAESI
jgi:hypothetical protein